MAENTKESKKQYVLFVGNPGVGKSTMLNCLRKIRDPEIKPEEFFSSGISIGSGLTSRLDQRQSGNIVYMDTPGLADTRKRKASAEAITEALKMNGLYQVVFVVTLEAGRVRPADIVTISLILSSAPEIRNYGLIFNKVSKSVIAKITPEKKQELVSQITLQTDENSPIPFTILLGKSSQLDEEDDTVVDIPVLGDLLFAVQPNLIRAENVSPIPTESYDEKTEEFEKKLSFYKQNQEEMKKKMLEDKERLEKSVGMILATQTAQHKAEIEAEMIAAAKEQTMMLQVIKKDEEKSNILYQQRLHEEMSHQQGGMVVQSQGRPGAPIPETSKQSLYGGKLQQPSVRNAAEHQGDWKQQAPSNASRDQKTIPARRQEPYNQELSTQNVAANYQGYMPQYGYATQSMQLSTPSNTSRDRDRDREMILRGGQGQYHQNYDYEQRMLAMETKQKKQKNRLVEFFSTLVSYVFD